MSAYLPILLVSVFAVISFIIAMNRGAIPILASGIGLLAALVLSVFFLNILILNNDILHMMIDLMFQLHHQNKSF